MLKLQETPQILQGVKKKLREGMRRVKECVSFLV